MACSKDEQKIEPSVVEIMQSETAPKDTTSLPFPNEATVEYKDQDYYFKFESGQHSFQIHADGQGQIIPETGPQIAFNLNLFHGDYIESISYYQFRSHLMVIYQCASENFDNGVMVLLDPKDGSVKWLKKIPGFNLGAGPVEDHFIYVTAIGFVGKLDLNNGNFVWKLEGLFQNNGSFSSFKRPVIQNDHIILSEDDVIKTQLKVLSLNKHTGALVD